jgi:hypothetical protein
MVSLRLTWLTSFVSCVTWQGDGEEQKTSDRWDGGGQVIFYELARSNFFVIRHLAAWTYSGHLPLLSDDYQAVLDPHHPTLPLFSPRHAAMLHDYRTCDIGKQVFQSMALSPPSFPSQTGH